MICFGHITIVDNVIGLCGLVKEANNYVVLPLSFLILSL